MAGEKGTVPISRPIAMVMAGCFGIAIYNTAEIFIYIFSIFTGRSGLYFWSIVTATLGILIHAIVMFLRAFALAPPLPMAIITIPSWIAMVTGQSVVLYSRLGLVTNARKMRLVLIMIITNFFIVHIPNGVLFIACNTKNPRPYIDAYDVYKKINLSIFSVQECFISGLYLWEVSTSFKPLLAIKGDAGRKMVRHLYALFLITVLLDGSLMAIQYTNNFQIQTTYKVLVYSTKLKIEIFILNELVAFTRTSASDQIFINTQSLDATRPSGIVSRDSRSGDTARQQV